MSFGPNTRPAKDARILRCAISAMSHAYAEDQLVEQPAIGLFAGLKWTAITARLNLGAKGLKK
mgnify:FL=1